MSSYTIAEEKKIIDLYSNVGFGYKKIGEIVGGSKTKIINCLLRNQIPLRTFNKPYTEDEVLRIVNLYLHEFLTIKEISEVVGGGYTKVRNCLKKNNIKMRLDKIEIDEDLLISKYIKEELTLREVGKFFGVSDTTVLRRLDELGIKRREKFLFKEKHIDEKEMLKIFFENGENPAEVGRKIGLDPKAVRSRLKKLGIKTKTRNTTKIKTLCSNCGKEIEIFQKRFECFEKHFCDKTCLFEFQRGENSPTWRGGVSFEPYCSLFNDDFKERTREFWGRKCVLCGKSEEENEKRLSVHHVDYDKKSCCVKDKFNSTPNLFIPLCKSCHGRTNQNRNYWETMFSNYIIIWFNGECYN